MGVLFTFSVASAMAGMTNWELCVLCQEQNEEQLICPLSNPIQQRGEGAYKEVIDLANQFKYVCAAPHPDVELPNEESMLDNRASWHKKCRQMYKMTLLDRANKRYSEGVCSATKRPRRASAGTSRNQCIFCSEDTVLIY